MAARSPGWLAVMAVQCRAEGVGRRIADPYGDLGESYRVATQQIVTLTENMARLGQKTVAAVLRHEHSQDEYGRYRCRTPEFQRIDRSASRHARGWSPLTQQVPLWASLLVGVGSGLLGGLATIVGQCLITRTDKKISRDEQRSALRADRRDAIYAFLEAAQELDGHMDGKYRIDKLDEGLARSAMHQLWYRRNCLKVLCSQPLAEAANRFAWRMHHAIWKGLTPEHPDVYSFMKADRDGFIAAAMDELYSHDIYESAPDRLKSAKSLRILRG